MPTRTRLRCEPTREGALTDAAKEFGSGGGLQIQICIPMLDRDSVASLEIESSSSPVCGQPLREPVGHPGYKWATQQQQL